MERKELDELIEAFEIKKNWWDQLGNEDRSKGIEECIQHLCAYRLMLFILGQNDMGPMCDCNELEHRFTDEGCVYRDV